MVIIESFPIKQLQEAIATRDRFRQYFGRDKVSLVVEETCTNLYKVVYQGTLEQLTDEILGREYQQGNLSVPIYLAQKEASDSLIRRGYNPKDFSGKITVTGNSQIDVAIAILGTKEVFQFKYQIQN